MAARYQPWIHRYALLTAAAAWLLPILAGALVTTTDAGMAFPDWPASDGQNMFLYPWLQSAGEKFLEHGHRLAGALIGVLSIGLAGLVAWRDSRVWLKCLAGGVLLCVILQGVLGGQRVLLEARGLAFLHGIFASWVFALMCCVAVCSSRGWLEAEQLTPVRWSGAWKWGTVVTVVLVATQYVLGALVRHQGMVLYEHAGFAVAVAVAAVWSAWSVSRAQVPWVSRAATRLVLLVALQLGLGLAAYVVKFGFGHYVAQHGSTLQISMRTAHVLVGMLVWMMSVLLALRVWRVDYYRSRQSVGSTVASGFSAAPIATSSLGVPGGTA